MYTSVCRVKNCKEPSHSEAITQFNENLCEKHYYHFKWYYLNLEYCVSEDGKLTDRQKDIKCSIREDKSVVDEKGFPVIDIEKSYVGVLPYGQMLFPDYIDTKKFGVPDFHKELLLLIAECIVKEGTYLDRILAIQCFRGASKSTWTSNIYPTYAITSHFVPEDLFPKDSVSYKFVKRLQLISEYVVIIMETADMASQAIEFQHDSLRANPYIRSYFGTVESTKTKDRVNEKYNSAEIFTSILPTGKKCRIRSRGAGQRFRGMRSLHVRPRWIIADDIESEENTATDILRKALNEWWNRVVINTVDVTNAVVINIGTMLGLDTILYKSLSDKNNRDIKINILTKPDLTNGKPVWEKRFPLHVVIQMWERAKQNSDEAGFWQEYFNIFAMEETKIFPFENTRFYKGEYKIIDGIRCNVVYGLWKPDVNTQKFYYVPFAEPKTFPIYIGIGADAAISEKTRSDDSSIAEAAISFQGVAFLMNIRSGKFAESDTFFDDESLDVLRLGVNGVMKDKKAIKRIGIPEEIVRIAWEYGKIDIVNIETYGYQKSLSNLLLKKANANKVYFDIQESAEAADKELKARLSIRPYWIASKFWMHESLMNTKTHSQFNFFPHFTHDDDVDSTALALRFLNNPPPVPQKVVVDKGTNLSPFLYQKVFKTELQSVSETDNILNNIYKNI